MAKGQKNNTLLIAKAHRALDDMKYEIASELGLPVHQGSEDYWGSIQTRDAGAVGGRITRKLVAFAEQYLVEKGNVN